MHSIEHSTIDQSQDFSSPEIETPEISPLRLKSIEHTAAILTEAKQEFARVGFLTPEAFDNEVPRRTAEIEADPHTSINMTPANLQRMLSEGSHRPLQSTGWNNLTTSEKNGKNLHEGYFDQRHAVEQQLANYADLPTGEVPVYAAIASGPWELQHGACPVYGNIAVILDEDAIDPRSTVYAWGDSLNGSLQWNDKNEVNGIGTPKVLTRDDAMVAKAVVNMTREYTGNFSGENHLVMMDAPEAKERMLSLQADYVESILFQDITPDMIGKVSVFGTTDNLAQALKVISGHPEIMERTSFVVQPDQPDLVKDYLASHFDVTVEQAPDADDIQRHQPDSERWKALGLDPSATPDVIRDTLLEKTRSLLMADSDIKTLLRRPGMIQKQHLQSVKGMNRVLNALKANLLTDTARDHYIQASALQEAALFFETISEPA